MAFHICVNGAIQQFDFNYIDAAAKHPRLEKTRVPGQATPPRPEGPIAKSYVVSMMSNPVICVDPQASIKQAKEQIARHGIHHLPVVTFKKIVGLLSDRDILERPTARTVNQLMSHTLVVCDDQTELRDACQVMLKEKISALPIIDRQNDLIGIITIRDMLRWICEERFL